MDSEEDLVERLIARLPIEEAEECLCQLEENLITVDVLRSADQGDLANEMGFNLRQCDAILLDDMHWRAKYRLEHAGAPDASSSETSKGERESGGSAMAETASGGQREREASAAAAAAIAGISQATVHPAMNAASGGGGSSSGVRDDDAGEPAAKKKKRRVAGGEARQAADCKLARCFEMFGGLEGSAGRADSGARRYR